jgi:hypothetical protein
VYYWVSPFEARLCFNQEVALVGADNSGGQAASQGAKVWMVGRRFDLSATMSRYLIDRINGLAGATGEQVWRAINHSFKMPREDERTRYTGGACVVFRASGAHQVISCTSSYRPAP